MKTSALSIALMISIALLGCSDSDESSGGSGYSSPETSGRNTSIAEAAEKAPATHYEKQIITTAELMKLLMDPIYENLKDAIEVPPQKRKAWRELYIQAFTLAEVNNLLFSRVDEKKEYLSTQLWIDESIEAVELLVTLAESIRAQSDYEVMKANFMTVVENCNQCHRVFEPGEVDEIVPPASWGIEVEEDPAKISFQ